MASEPSATERPYPVEEAPPVEGCPVPLPNVPVRDDTPPDLARAVAGVAEAAAHNTGLALDYATAAGLTCPALSAAQP